MTFKLGARSSGLLDPVISWPVINAHNLIPATIAAALLPKTACEWNFVVNREFDRRQR